MQVWNSPRYNADMKKLTPIITLLTDFGEIDSYVGAMKGVILNIIPDATLIDISHNVAPQNIRQAANIIANVYQYYPTHTVHLVVVDPGVGSERKPIAMRTPAGIFIAPDNGVLTYVSEGVDNWKAVALDNTEYWLPGASHTFHGRDIFSPAAAHLANGIPLENMGSPQDKIKTIVRAPLKISENTIQGEVVRIDHFGNVITNIQPITWIGTHSLELNLSRIEHNRKPLQFSANQVHISFSWHTIKTIHQNYSQVEVGQAVAIIGSYGELEISVNHGSAADKLGIREGDPIILKITH